MILEAPNCTIPGYITFTIPVQCSILLVQVHSNSPIIVYVQTIFRGFVKTLQSLLSVALLALMPIFLLFSSCYHPQLRSGNTLHPNVQTSPRRII